MKKKKIKECNKNENSRRIKCELKQKNNMFSRYLTHFLSPLPGHTVFNQRGLAKGKVEYMGEVTM